MLTCLLIIFCCCEVYLRLQSRGSVLWALHVWPTNPRERLTTLVPEHLCGIGHSLVGLIICVLWGSLVQMYCNWFVVSWSSLMVFSTGWLSCSSQLLILLASFPFYPCSAKLVQLCYGYVSVCLSVCLIFLAQRPLSALFYQGIRYLPKYGTSL